MDGNDFWRAQLRTQMIEQETGLTLAEQAAMPLDEWGRLVHGRTPTQAALAALDAQDFTPPGQDTAAVAEAQHPAQAPAPGPQGIDVAALSIEQYAQLRGQLGMGRSQQEGKGIFDSVASRSGAYTDAVRAQAGRTGWTTSNVVESPRLERRYARPDVQPDTRPAVQRFSTPGNSYGSA